MGREIIRTKNFAADAVNFIVDLARNSLAERNEFRIALSGGNTPRRVYTKLARTGRDLPWERTLITFGDERCVPPDDEQSNYRMARETLVVPAHLPDKTRKADLRRAQRRSEISRLASESERGRCNLDSWPTILSDCRSCRRLS